MKYWKPLLFIILLIGVLVVVKIFVFPSPNAKMKAPAGPPPPTNATGYISKYQALDNQVYATGSLIANEIIDISSEVAGKIVYLNIPEGQIINKGQLIARVNDADLQAQLKKLQVQLSISKSKEDRAKKLLDINGLSVEEYEDALNSHNILKAEIEYTKALLAKTEIKAPFTGKLGFKMVSDGSFVNTSTVISTLQQINPIKIEFSIPEKYTQEVKVGNTISFQVDGLNETFTAKVYALQPNIDINSRSVVMRAKANNTSSILKPGAFARINLSLGVDEQAIMVPTQAIIPVLKGQEILIAKNGIVKVQPVTLGFRGDKKVQVVEGLNVGDTILTTALMSLRDGSPVIVNKIVE
ncbi:MAG TPA: efflux RND transporter periplasmic adaptor subunit [Chitinophagales bacterium]|nr:efflux RND transporter periplasmic adaptor subunit [Chitinophagales bacterium]